MIRSTIIIAAIVLLSAALPAQGTKADYERARAVADEPRVLRTLPTAAIRFSKDESSVYFRDSAAKSPTWVVVTRTDKKREPLFDPQKLAASLAKSTGQDTPADRLPIADLTVEGNVLDILLTESPWRASYDRSTSALSIVDFADADPFLLRPQNGERRSRGRGDSSGIVFINQSSTSVTIEWIDQDGKARLYGELAPGTGRLQHTFGGHAWRAKMSDGTPLGHVVADDAVRAYLIKDKVAAETRTSDEPRRIRGDSRKERKFTAETRDGNVRLRDIATGKETALTHDGTNEDGFTDGIHWSPQGTHFFAMRTKRSPARKISFVESSPRDQLQPKIHTFDYRKPGDELDRPTPHLFDAENAREIEIGVPFWENPWSINDVRFSPDGAYVYFLYNQRGHQVIRLCRIETATGVTTAIVQEESPTFIDYVNSVWYRILDETREILWMSERDGTRRIYLVDGVSGELKNPVTPKGWVVRGVEDVDLEDRSLIIRVAACYPDQDPYHIHFARCFFDGRPPILLTSGDGTHDVDFSPSKKSLIARHSRVDLPPIVEWRDAVTGALVAELDRAEKPSRRLPERFVAKGRDGTTDIWGIIHFPKSFDPKKKYPIIEQIYAGPHDHHVPKEFRERFGTEELAELGFIIVQIDGMGTAHRTKAFHDVCWKNLVDAGFPDRILWIKAAAKKFPAMNVDRVGSFGGSAGGQNALAALLTHGDFYKAAVADCGCHDNRMDKIWWNELWMGWPIGDEYAANSNVTLAKNLGGKLLLIVGEMDRNVDPASTMQVVDALVRADKDFDLLVIPGGGHGAGGSPYGRRRTHDFFVRALWGAEPRRP